MILFHLSPQRLGAGSVILPGNYGRLLTVHGWPHAASHREAILEGIRVQSFAHLPSRLGCVFCFARVEDADTFRAEFDGFKHHALHRVRAATSGVVVHETDWRWINPAEHGTAFPHLAWAVAYWNGLPAAGPDRAGTPVSAEMAMGAGQKREVLVGGPVVVEQCLDGS